MHIQISAAARPKINKGTISLEVAALFKKHDILRIYVDVKGKYSTGIYSYSIVRNKINKKKLNADKIKFYQANVDTVN